MEAIPPVVIEFYILPPVHCLQTLHASGSMLNFIIREYQNTLRYRLPAIKVNLYFVNFFLFKKIVVYLFLAVLGLHCCVWVFLVVESRGYSLVVVHGLFNCCGYPSCRTQAL